MMGVRLDGWGSVKTSELRRGDENRPQRWILASSRVNGTAVPGSLFEGAAERSEAEGVSFVGCSGPLVYTPTHINSEFLSGYVHRSTLPQLRCAQQLPQRGSREGADHSTGYSLKSGVTGDFHRPYEGRVPFTAPPGKSNVAGDFHRPYESSDGFCFPHAGGAAYILPGAKKDEIFTSRSLHNR